MKSIKSLFKLTVLTVLVIQGVIFTSCTGNEDLLNENIEVNNEEITEDKIDESSLVDIEDVLFTQKSKRNNMSSRYNCSNVSKFIQMTEIRSYSWFYKNYPINSFYKFVYQNKTYLLKKTKNTGNYRNDFRTIGTCSNSIVPVKTLANSELVGKWKVIEGNNVERNSNIILYIYKNDIVGIRSCNIYGNIRTSGFSDYSYRNHKRGDVGFNTNGVRAATSNNCGSNEQTKINKFIKELAQVKKWRVKGQYLELTTEDSYFPGAADLYLQKMSNL